MPIILLLILLAIYAALVMACNPHPAERTVSWEEAGLRVDIAYPGGNAIVEAISGDEIRVRQDQRDTDQWWFHWSFQVHGAAGRTLHCRFSDGKPVGVRGPALSLDQGRTWQWLEQQAGDQSNAFVFRCPDDIDTVRFAMGIPHQQTDWQALLARHAGHPALVSGELCRSRQGRLVEQARIGRSGPAAPWCLLVTARHHCCEAMAGYVLEGLLAAAFAADDHGRWWQEQVDLLAVPFVDKDGVEEGDQGKGRRPRDHGRDYLGESLYPETAAIRQRVPDWLAGRPVIVLDLHCPWIAGDYNQHIYQVGAEDPVNAAQQVRLGTILEASVTGPLPYRAGNDLPFGTSWNTDSNYSGGCGIRRWANTLPECRLATTIEIPYADAQGVALSPDAARHFGTDLAQALQRYMRETDLPA